MPYKSESQRRLFHYLQSKGEISKKTVNEFDKTSKGMNLPERVKMSHGGMVEDLTDEDQMYLDMETEDTSGDQMEEKPSKNDFFYKLRNKIYRSR